MLRVETEGIKINIKSIFYISFAGGIALVKYSEGTEKYEQYFIKSIKCPSYIQA